MNLFFALTLFFSSFAFSFENANLKFQDPAGWVKQPTEVCGVNAILFSIPSAKRGSAAAILVSTTSKRPDKSDAASVMKKSFEGESKKYRDFKFVALKNIKTLKSPHALGQFTFTKNSIKQKGLALLIQSGKNNHVFHFSVGEDFYSSYEAEVLGVFGSAKIKN